VVSPSAVIERLEPGAAAAAPSAERGPDDAPRSRLTVDGRAAPQSVAGVVLEAAFRCDGRTLVLLTDDVPHEDALHIHLLDPELRLLDSASLSWPYATGAFAFVGLAAPSTVRFRFFGDTDWTVEVLAAPEGRLPLIGEPRGVHRRFGFQRHFRIDGQPQADDTAR